MPKTRYQILIIKAIMMAIMKILDPSKLNWWRSWRMPLFPIESIIKYSELNYQWWMTYGTY
jgi:hypothetical protein